MGAIHDGDRIKAPSDNLRRPTTTVTARTQRQRHSIAVHHLQANQRAKEGVSFPSLSFLIFFLSLILGFGLEEVWPKEKVVTLQHEELRMGCPQRPPQKVILPAPDDRTGKLVLQGGGG